MRFSILILLLALCACDDKRTPEQREADAKADQTQREINVKSSLTKIIEVDGVKLYRVEDGYQNVWFTVPSGSTYFTYDHRVGKVTHHEPRLVVNRGDKQ